MKSVNKLLLNWLARSSTINNSVKEHSSFRKTADLEMSTMFGRVTAHVFVVYPSESIINTTGIY